MYDWLKSLIQSINKPLLLGDFNEIMHPCERIGQFRYDLSIREFLDWNHDLYLIDIPLYGLKYAWSMNESHSRLDRGLCNNDWLIKFLDLRLEGLKKCFSDHNPLVLLMKKTLNWGPKPFRCFDAWFLNSDFKRFVCKEWKDLPNLHLNSKLRALKGPMRNWMMRI